MTYRWPTDKIAADATPVFAYGLRRFSWLHPRKPAYLRMWFVRDGRTTSGPLTYYCEDQAGARRRGHEFLERWS